MSDTKTAQIASNRKTPSSLVVAFFRSQATGQVVGFDVRGHAEYGPAGQDIVCAAVSALSQAALLGLEEFADTELTQEVRKGYMRVRLSGSPEQREQVYAVIRVLELGLAGIRRSYPGHLRVTYEEVRK